MLLFTYKFKRILGLGFEVELSIGAPAPQCLAKVLDSFFRQMTSYADEAFWRTTTDNHIQGDGMTTVERS